MSSRAKLVKRMYLFQNKYYCLVKTVQKISLYDREFLAKSQLLVSGKDKVKRGKSALDYIKQLIEEMDD